MFRKFESQPCITSPRRQGLRWVGFTLGLLAVAALAVAAGSAARTPEQIQAFWQGCERDSNFWKQTAAPPKPADNGALPCATGAAPPLDDRVSHGIVGLDRVLNNATAPSLYQFGEDLYRNALAVAVSNYVELNYTFRGKEDFSDADLKPLCAAGCPAERLPEIRQTVAATLARLKASGVKPVTPQQALEQINVKLTGLNDDLSGNVKLPSGQAYYNDKQLAENRTIYPTSESTSPNDYVDRGLVGTRYYNATSPANDRARATGKQRYEAYRTRYLEAVSDGAGKLLMTDALRSRTGPMISPTDMEKDGSGRVVLKQHRLLDPSSGAKDIDKAVTQAIDAARDHAAELLPPLWDLQREAKKAYGPMPGPMPEMNFSGRAIAKLVQENPAIVGFMLAEGHDHDHDACFAINRARVYGDEKAKSDRLVRNGITVFAGALALTGVGAVWGSLILSGVSASAATFAALGSTLSLAGSATHIGGNIMAAIADTRESRRLESRFQSGGASAEQTAPEANRLAAQAEKEKHDAEMEALRMVAFGAAQRAGKALLRNTPATPTLNAASAEAQAGAAAPVPRPVNVSEADAANPEFMRNYGKYVDDYKKALKTDALPLKIPDRSVFNTPARVEERGVTVLLNKDGLPAAPEEDVYGILNKNGVQYSGKTLRATPGSRGQKTLGTRLIRTPDRPPPGEPVITQRPPHVSEENFANPQFMSRYRQYVKDYKTALRKDVHPISSEARAALSAPDRVKTFGRVVFLNKEGVPAGPEEQAYGLMTRDGVYLGNKELSRLIGSDGEMYRGFKIVPAPDGLLDQFVKDSFVVPDTK